MFAKGWGQGQIMQYLPELETDILKFPRAYIASIIYTIADQEFKAWAQARIQERNRKVAEKNDLNMGIDPELKAFFVASTAVSREK